MALPREVGFGIIGVGGIGKTHAKSIAAIEGAKLVAVCDTVEERAQKIAEEYGAIPYTDYRKMVERDDLEIVNICTPSGMHGDMAIDCANAGKHVLCEKPIDIHLDKIDAMIETAERNRITLSCIFQNRFSDAARRIKQAIEAGRLGRLLYGDAAVKWYRTQEYYDAGGWRGTWQWDGGGALMNQSVHYIDLLQWFMGPARRVWGRTGTMNHKIETEDLGVATLEFENGALGQIVGTTCAHPGLGTRIDVIGSQGTVVWEDGEIKRWELLEGEKEEIASDAATLGSGAADPWAISAGGHQRQIEYFAHCVIEGKPAEPTAREARKSVEIILSIYESSRRGEPVTLPLKL